ncbi:MAG: bis(5'-nucleosyl)-tetraphosphatase (symmetrical) YqeK [Peptococcaceae bacterium]
MPEKYTDLIKKKLSSKRYKHSLGVAATAGKLAELNDAEPETAYLAGILHDYAKELSAERLLEIAKGADLISDEIELQEPQLLHGPVSALLVREELGITDMDILDAIKYHTTGCPDMKLLTKIIYIADYIEPHREFPGVEKLREAAYENLDLGVLQGLNLTLQHVLEQNGLMHCLSVQARNRLLLSRKRGQA